MNQKGIVKEPFGSQKRKRLVLWISVPPRRAGESERKNPNPRTQLLMV
jgi:hypothetical protein